MLNDEQKSQYQKLRDCQNELADLMEQSAFAEGFCIAAKLMSEVMDRMEIPHIDT